MYQRVCDAFEVATAPVGAVRLYAKSVAVAMYRCTQVAIKHLLGGEEGAAKLRELVAFKRGVESYARLPAEQREAIESAAHEQMQAIEQALRARRASGDGGN